MGTATGEVTTTSCMASGAGSVAVSAMVSEEYLETEWSEKVFGIRGGRFGHVIIQSFKH